MLACYHRERRRYTTHALHEYGTANAERGGDAAVAK